MKTIVDLFATIFSADPDPEAPPTRLITQNTTPPWRFGAPITSTSTLNGRSLIDMSRMTKETLRQIIDGVDADPLAGMGAFTKKDLLIDRLLAHWNTVGPRDAQQSTSPKSILSDASKDVPVNKPEMQVQPPGIGGIPAPRLTTASG